ncbi:MAG: hypothetical protein EBQ51_00580 [Verrucomicrobia bacterium]|nr:hypothetical protein [Verrucomicrobiota bacterium]
MRVHLQHIAQVMPQDGIVLLALDGENAWEAFPDSGEAFLDEFYLRLEKTRGLSSATLGGYLDKHEGKQAGRLHSGSWIGGNFDIWIGDPEENQGWSWIKRTRDFLLREEEKGNLSPEVKAAAWEDLYAAEGSDWFWWYGPDFQTDSDLIFDGLFRGRLQNVYRRLGVTPPAGLSVPICSAEVRLGVAPTRPIEPRLGEAPSFLDWAGAGRYEAWRDQGAMAQGGPACQKHLLRVWEEGLLFPIGFEGDGRGRGDCGFSAPHSRSVANDPPWGRLAGAVGKIEGRGGL